MQADKPKANIHQILEQIFQQYFNNNLCLLCDAQYDVLWSLENQVKPFSPVSLSLSEIPNAMNCAVGTKLFEYIANSL